jgi:outer membrane protein assembly factor BamB
MAAGLMALQLFGASASPGTLLWNYSTGAIVNSSPAIGADGTIYFGSDANVTYALTPNGQMKWQVPFGGSPVIALDGSILLGTVDGLKAYRADGSLKWEYATERIVLHVSNLPAVAADGTIYFQGHDARFHALTANGTPKWSLPIDPGLYGGGHPAIAQDGTIYIGTAYGKLFAIDPNGTIKWQFDAGNRINSPAIGPDGTIYAASDDSNLYALAPDKTERWRFTTGGPIYTGAIVGADGRVYVASFDSNLYCLNSNGTKAWHFTAGGGLVGAPALAADGTVYIGGRDSRLRAINPQGVEMWAFVAQHWFDFSSPAIGSNGTVYVGSWDGNLYAICGNSPLSSGSWPKFGADVGSTGQVQPSCNDLLAAAIAEFEQAQAELALVRSELTASETEKASLEAEIADINSSLARLTDHWRALFRDRSFTIPGNSPSEQLGRILHAIQQTNFGQQQAIYRNLGGKPGNGRSPD